jgi:hypothetical protein
MSHRDTALAARLASIASITSIVLAASACAGGSEPHGAPAADAAAGDAGTTDPFAPEPDRSAGLTNVASDLGALLENGTLAQACTDYNAGQTDQKTMLACGKWMFFYDPLATFGIPSALVTFMAKNFPDQLGSGFSKLGLVPDPTSQDDLPLGLAATTPLTGNIPAVAFTCASCHFAQLPDGRYAVGAPNHAFDYARMILMLTIAPEVGTGLGSAGAHDAAAIAEIQPVLDALGSDAALKDQFLLALLPLASVKLPAMSTTVEHEYTTWPTGTLDFMIAPLPVDDGVEIVTKMIGLWGLPDPAEASAAGMSSELLAWTGDAHSLEGFVQGFATLGGTTPPSDSAIAPLVQYIYSLQAPANPAPPDPAQVATGEQLYRSAGCIGCHGAPRGAGTRTFTFDEIGTDDALARWADPDLSGSACCGLPIPPGGLSHGVKSPRLVGMWAQGRFLHDGTLSTLDQVFCRSDRGSAGTPPLGTGGHAFTCDNLTDADKQALEAYLLAH